MYISSIVNLSSIKPNRFFGTFFHLLNVFHHVAYLLSSNITNLTSIHFILPRSKIYFSPIPASFIYIFVCNFWSSQTRFKSRVCMCLCVQEWEMRDFSCPSSLWPQYIWSTLSAKRTNCPHYTKCSNCSFGCLHF